MKRPTRSALLLVLLLLLLPVQLSILIPRFTPSASSPPWLGVGDSLQGMTALTSNRRPALLANGVPTILLIYRSDCGHCQSVAPLWRSWLDGAGKDRRAVALTSEGRKGGQRFLREHDLDVRMLMIEEGPPGSLSQKLMARTPWVFLLDEAGIIQAQGHGSQIADLERTLRHRFEGVAKP